MYEKNNFINNKSNSNNNNDSNDNNDSKNYKNMRVHIKVEKNIVMPFEEFC